jgi:hypothetical protein
MNRLEFLDAAWRLGLPLTQSDADAWLRNRNMAAEFDGPRQIAALRVNRFKQSLLLARRVLSPLRRSGET